MKHTKFTITLDNAISNIFTIIFFYCSQTIFLFFLLLETIPFTYQTNLIFHFSLSVSQ